MKINIENKEVEELVQLLIYETLDINELHLAKQKQREAFLKLIKKRPNLLSRVKPQYANHFFTVAINEDHEYFVYLKREQYTDELAQLYLSKRLENVNDDGRDKSQNLIVQKSMDNKIIFNYSYVTPEDEELYYLDKELEVPTSIKSSIKISLKLVDAVKMIDKLDTHITELGEKKIRSVLSDIIDNNYKSYLNSFINEKNAGYYTLCTSLKELELGFTEEMRTVFAPYGIDIIGFTIKKIAIPKDIQHKIEDQAFRVRQRRAEIVADAEFAKKSLENYEAKLSIQQKYPDSAKSLTEYEKDLALKRYLIKTGCLSEQEIDRSIKIVQKAEQADTAIKKAEDIVPNVPQKKNVFKSAFFSWLTLCLLVSAIVMFTNLGVGFILLGITSATFGVIAALTHHKFAKQTIEPNVGGEDDARSFT